MLDEHEENYGVIIILSGLLNRPVPDLLNVHLRRRGGDVFGVDDTMMIVPNVCGMGLKFAWLSLRRA